MKANWREVTIAQMQQVKVIEMIEGLTAAISDRGIEKVLQKLKDRARDLEDLEDKDYEQQAADEDDLPCLEIAQKVKEAIQVSED